MLSLDDARRRLLARAVPLDGEPLALAEADGRVLVSAAVVSSVDVPGFDNSAMDGYAVRAADTPGSLRVIGEVAAGMAEPPAVEVGTTVRIMTGAPMPPGADAIVPIEEAGDEEGGRVPLPAARPGTHVRSAGHDTRAGDEVHVAGVLTPPKIAVLASLGIATVLVRRRPAVAILSTGDELVEIGTPLGPNQVHDANGVALAAAVRDAGGRAVLLPRAPDDANRIDALLTAAARNADLLVTSAGVSVGRHDHVRGVLERRGSLDFWRIAVQPGKPLAVGEIDGVTLIGLPGNPVSALVVFELFVRPFIRGMLGLPGDGRIRTSAAPDRRMGKDPGRRAFLRVIVRDEAGHILASPAGGQASSQLRPLADANGLLIVPEGVDAADPAQRYETILLEPVTVGAVA